MSRSNTMISAGLFLFLFSLAVPPDLVAQGFIPDCKPTCTTYGCEPDEYQGIGNGAGILDGDCWLEDWCHTPCGEDPTEEAAAALSVFGDILLGLKYAKTPEDLNRLALAYRDRLLLNASQNMVVALGGCTAEDLVPVSMVLLPDAQFQQLQELSLGTLDAFLSEEGER